MFDQEGICYLKITIAVTEGVLCKKLFIKISQHSQENTFLRVFFSKLPDEVYNFIKKESPVQAFFCELC